MGAAGSEQDLVAIAWSASDTRFATAHAHRLIIQSTSPRLVLRLIKVGWTENYMTL
jgi:hypothetical protein